MGFLNKEVPDSVGQNLNPKYELRPYKFHDGDTVRIEAQDKEIVLVPEPEAQPQAEEPEALPAA